MLKPVLTLLFLSAALSRAGLAAPDAPDSTDLLRGAILPQRSEEVAAYDSAVQGGDAAMSNRAAPGAPAGHRYQPFGVTLVWDKVALEMALRPDGSFQTRTSAERAALRADGAALKPLEGDALWVAPGIWTEFLAGQNAVLAQKPDDSLALAKRAAAWHFVTTVQNPHFLVAAEKLPRVGRNNTSRITDNFSSVTEFPNNRLLDADLARLWKAPVGEDTLRWAADSHRVLDYSPLSSGNNSPEVARLDAVLARYGGAAPKTIVDQRLIVAGKSALYALGAKNRSASDRVTRFLGAAKALATRRGDEIGALPFFALAVESASQTNLDLATREASLRLENSGVAAEVESEIVLTLDGAGLPAQAKKWAEILQKHALKGDAANRLPEPLRSGAPVSTAQIEMAPIQIALATALPPNSDARFAILNSYAARLPITSRHKVLALAQLRDMARARGDKDTELKALSDGIMAGGPPFLWAELSALASEMGLYDLAFNANRIAIAWENPSGTKSVADYGLLAPKVEAPKSATLVRKPGDLRDPDDPAFDEDFAPITVAELEAANAMRRGDNGKDEVAPDTPPPSPLVLRLFEGAYLLTKLGYHSAARGEYDALTRRLVISKGDEAALMIFRRFLRAELQKTPDDLGLKYGFDAISGVFARQLQNEVDAAINGADETAKAAAAAVKAREQLPK